MIYTNPVFNKVGKIVWAAYLVIIPLIAIVAALFAKPDDSMGIAKIGILVVWLLMVCHQIITAIKSVKIRKAKQE